MARNKEKIKKRNESVVEHFNMLCNKKTEKGKTKYSSAYILEKVAEKFYLSERTVENILKGK